MINVESMRAAKTAEMETWRRVISSMANQGLEFYSVDVYDRLKSENLVHPRWKDWDYRRIAKLLLELEKEGKLKSCLREVDRRRRRYFKAP
jgi:hypothetical protein